MIYNDKTSSYEELLEKGAKQNLKNYRPTFLLLVALKIFERILYNNMYEFFTENNLISLTNQL